MSNIVPLKELRANLASYTDRVLENNESFLVLRRSKPAFKIVPVEEETWETAIDFTEISPLGAPIEHVREALQKMDD